jgi:hypothetical protein
MFCGDPTGPKPECMICGDAGTLNPFWSWPPGGDPATQLGLLAKEVGGTEPIGVQEVWL